MRDIALAALIVLAQATGGFARCTTTSAIRVRYYGCQVTSGHFKFGNIDATLPKADTDVYQGTVTGEVDPGYQLSVAKSIPMCCTQPPRPEWKEKCVLEYVVFCDSRNPGWSIETKSADNGYTFDFVPEHMNDFSDLACPAKATIDPITGRVENLGDNDVVEIGVYRLGIMLVRFPVALKDVQNGPYSATSADLAKIRDEEASQSNSSFSGQTRDYKNALPPLPTKVTVTKR